MFVLYHNHHQILMVKSKLYSEKVVVIKSNTFMWIASFIKNYAFKDIKSNLLQDLYYIDSACSHKHSSKNASW